MAIENDTSETKKKNESDQESSSLWGTLEELLLACAVNRYGTRSWDSVAMEIQTRSSNLPSLTPHNCKQKYHDLKRRFMAGPDGTDGCDESEMERLVPMVDELKRLRVAELRREVQRRDVSIVSLELKVKRLEEEREQSFKENNNTKEIEADLRKDQEKEKEREQERREASPENDAGKSISGWESDYRENGSYNESNSITQKGEIRGTEAHEQQVKVEPVAPAVVEPDPVRTESKPVGDWSNNSSLETVAKKKGGVLKVAEATIPAGGIGESNEFAESIFESKREGKEGTKQSSDVQSSASLSRKKRRRRSGGGVAIGSSSGEEEPEGDEVSPAIKQIAVKSEPLVRFLVIIRSHKLGSVFERRLWSQETEKHKKLIRQHMHLDTVQSRLDKGVYCDCIQRFFRDLLLLFNNAVVFFSKGSPESLAAHELRSLVLTEMANKIRKPDPITIKPDPDQRPVLTRVKLNNNSSSKNDKKKTTRSMVVCRKRSNAKGERALEEKAKVDGKKSDDGDRFAKSVMDRRTRERPVLGRRSQSGEKMKHECGSNVLSSHDDLEAKIENKDSVAKKKQGAASFLKRMKRNSSPSNEVLVGENVDVSEDDSKDGKGVKKRRGRRRDGRRDRVTRRSGSGGGGGGGGRKEQNGQVIKRGVGRPPKRQAATSSVESLPGGGGGRGKRRKERGGESEVVVGRPRKCSRR